MNPNSLVTSCCPGFKRDLAAADTECFGQKTDQMAVGLSLGGRSGNPQAPSLVLNLCEFISAGLGLYPQMQH